MAHQSASTLLWTLVSALVLFAVLFAVSSSSLLSKYAYKINIKDGWSFPIGRAGVCEKLHVPDKGFPLVDKQANYQNPDCYGTNYFAAAMNAALCFALTAIVSVPVARALEERYG